ncbi:hypothetical protein D9M71_479210 [compost metagenome]
MVHGLGEHLALHGNHFLLVFGMHGLVAQVEFVRQVALVDQHEAHRLAGFYLQAFGLEGNVLEHHVDRAGGLGRRGRLAKGEALRLASDSRQAAQGKGGGNEQVFHDDSGNTQQDEATLAGATGSYLTGTLQLRQFGRAGTSSRIISPTPLPLC